MPINSRDKGVRGEREWAEVMRSYDFNARRGQQFQGGTDSPDVVCQELSGFHFEVKRVEKGSLYEWLAQATNDAAPHQVPVVAHRRNDHAWVVVLPADRFLALLQNAQRAGIIV